MQHVPIAEFVDQHVEDAAFLWLLCEAASGSTMYEREDVAELDTRIKAHLDGLEIAGQTGLQRSLEELQIHFEDGEALVATALSLRLRSSEGMHRVLDAAFESTHRGVAVAFC